MLQVLLTRVFSFTIWYHLAYLTISTALLGFGAAGSILSGFPKIWTGNVPRFSGLAAGAAGITIFIALLILAPWPMDPRQMVGAPAQFFTKLLVYYVILAIPFVFAGLAVATPLSAYPAFVNRLYAVDLMGGALGCLLAVGALVWFSAPQAVTVCAALFLAAGAAYANKGTLRYGLGAFTVGALALLPVSDAILKFQPAPSKVLGQILAQEGSEIIYSEWSPINRVDVSKDTAGMAGFTFWGAFGVDPAYDGPRPGGYGIQYDGHNGSTIYRVGDLDDMQILDQHLLRTPYLLVEEPKVLVIGVGGGIDIFNALRRDAKSVTGVELQPITIELHNERFADWTGGHLQRSEVTLVGGEGRHYVRSSEETYDLIQITATDTFSAQATGAYVLAESYLYTVEAIDDYLGHLSEDGVLSIVLGDVRYGEPGMPPGMATRLALSARESLAKIGVNDSRNHLAYVGQDAANFDAIGSPERSNTSTVEGTTFGALIIKKSPFTQSQTARIREFAEDNKFRVELLPDAANLGDMAALVNQPESRLSAALDEQKLYLNPATDDRPFFYHVLRWTSLLTGERILWTHPGSTTGQLVLIMMLVQAIVLGCLFILLPLTRGARETFSTKHTTGFLLYFLSLGVGFMLIEISFVQKYVLLLGYPTYSLSVTILSLLLFASMGAALSRRFWNIPPSYFLSRLLAVTVVLVLVEILLLPAIRESFLGSSLTVRIAITALLQLPLGICLGMYFTTGIEILRTRAPRLVPWAWAVNGIGSVLSTVLAVILAMSIGFSGVALVALGVYATGVLSMLYVLRRGTHYPKSVSEPLIPSAQRIS